MHFLIARLRFWSKKKKNKDRVIGGTLITQFQIIDELLYKFYKDHTVTQNVQKTN